ncbi:MAG: hypothetical protein HZA48_01070 [Planctomycetes bacterium]|nr:hypothetical protein [Planctomycetota bacterium]
MNGFFVTIKNSGICWTARKDYSGYIEIFSQPPAGLPSTGAGRHSHPIYTIPETGERLIIKQYRRGGLISHLNKKTFLDKNRAFNEMKLSQYALEKSVPTAQIVAAGYKAIIPGIYHLHIVSKMIENARPLPEFLCDLNANDLNSAKEAAQAVTEAILRLHNAGILHCDLNANNILIGSSSKNKLSAYIIDLDKSSVNNELPFNRRIKNLQRLDRSMKKLKDAGKLNMRVEMPCFSELYAKYEP